MRNGFGDFVEIICFVQLEYIQGAHDYNVLKFSIKDHCHYSEAARIKEDISLTNMGKRTILTMEPTSCMINECVNRSIDTVMVCSIFDCSDICQGITKNIALK